MAILTRQKLLLSVLTIITLQYTTNEVKLVNCEFVNKIPPSSSAWSPSDGEMFYNTGQTKKYKDPHGKLENSVLKSKIQVLGQVFKKHVNYLRTVSNKQVELVFLVDASASVGAENFVSEIKFVQKLLADFTVSQDTTRIAVITFASKDQVVRHVDHISQPSVDNHKCGLLHHELPAIKYTGGGTYTLGALLEAQAVLKYARPSAQKAIFLVTDGYSNGGDPIPVANQLKQSGVTIFTFGIRNGNTKELFQVASVPGQEFSYILDSFPEFQSLARRALHQDLKSGEYQLLDNVSHCDQLCPNKTACCHESAQCACGIDTGHYSCLCPPGYYGHGQAKPCQACPNGTYSDVSSPGDVSICQPCPDVNHVTLHVATSPDHCSCNAGFQAQGNSCQVITCPKLESPLNGYFVKKSCLNVLNAACGSRCSVGYQLIGSSIRLCQENGTWSGEEAKCIVKTCPALKSPANGAMNCTRVDLALDTECVATCDAGFHLVGSKRRTCLPLGRWDGLSAACKSLMCPPLPRVSHGVVDPPDCLTAKRPYGTRCNVSCEAGFTLKGPVKRTCGGQGGVWSSKHIVNTCLDVTPPTIQCPPHIVTTTDLDENYATVNWTSPLVADNSGKMPTVWTKPAIKLPMKAKIGVTTVMYVAADGSRNKARCTFTVTVRDVQPPAVEGCESPPTFLTNDGQNVTVAFDAPRFTDNSGKHVKVERTPASDWFSYGTHPVSYVATDQSGNNSTCSLNITVQANVCERPSDPLNGNMNCTTLSESLHCTLTCEEGYAFAIVPRDYFCMYEEETDSLLAPEAAVDPIPDCSVSVIPNTISQDGSVTLEGDDLLCQDVDLLDQVRNEVRARIVAKMEESCDNDLSCGVGNVTAACDQTLSNHEETSNAITRRRRETDVRYLTDTVYVVEPTDSPRAARTKIEVHFKMIGQTKNGNADLDAGLRKVKDSLEELANESAAERGAASSKRKKLKVKRIGFKPETSLGCPDGALLKGSMCVKCPLGTHHNATSRSCESCRFGEYQPLEGQLQCEQCPPGSSTRRIHARHSTECKPLCPSGSHSRHRKLSRQVPGVTPCVTCDAGSYQPVTGQLACVACPANTTTLKRGAISEQQCLAICGAGFYSSSGLAPCYPCEVKSALDTCEPVNADHCRSGPCANGANCTSTEQGYFLCDCAPGYAGSYCEVALNGCESNPCLHDGACLDAGNGSFTCLCPHGYSGQRCEVDVDECSSAPCLHNGLCVDRVDSFICLFCDEGYTGVDCGEDVNECAAAPCMNQATCVDAVNNYTCVCGGGHTGRHCQEAPHDLCDLEPCENGGDCFLVDVNAFKCWCPAGYSGPRCETHACSPSPCLNGGACHAHRAGYRCTCVAPYAGQHCETSLPADFVLQFPVAGTTDYVAVRGPSAPLHEVTVCLWLKSADRFNYGTVFSYATAAVDNSFTLTDYNGFVLYVNGLRVITDIIANDGVWHSVCVTWRSTDGDWAVHIDGRVGDRGTGLANGTSIPANGSLILGQEQDRLGGGFSQSESFMGQLSSVAMWDRVLAPREIGDLATLCGADNRGNVFAWSDFVTGIRGQLKVEPSPFCSGCPPPSSPFQGGVNVTTADVAVYTCQPGYNLRWPDGDVATVHVRKCLKQGEWEGDTPICTRLNCGFPGYFPHGVITGRSYRYGDRLEYHCGAGYQLVGEPRRSCEETGRWSGTVPSCQGRSCDLPPVPPHGKINKFFETDDPRPSDDASSPQYGHQMELECDPGYQHDNYNVITCLENGQWDDVFPTCRPIACPPPKSLVDGTVARNNVKNVSTNFRDKEDSALVDSTIARNYDKNVSMNFGDKDESALVNSTIARNYDENVSATRSGEEPDLDVFVFADELLVKCNEGFQLVGPAARSCLSSGIWSSVEPTCKRVQCDVDKIPFYSEHFSAANDFRLKIFENDIGNGVFEISGNSYGDAATFSCKEGYRFVGGGGGVLRWDCQADGSWAMAGDGADAVGAAVETLCQTVESNCSEPIVPANGYLLNEVSSVNGTIPVGTLADFKCRLGYVLNGPDQSVCQHDGQWSSANTTKCQPVECKRLPAPLYAVTVAAATLVYGNMVTFVCEDGYRAYGDLSTRCQANGRWARIRGKCSRVSCGKPVISAGAAVLGQSYLYQDKVTYQCPQGSRVSGSPVLTCLLDGTWDQQVTCQSNP